MSYGHERAKRLATEFVNGIDEIEATPAEKLEFVAIGSRHVGQYVEVLEKKAGIVNEPAEEGVETPGGDSTIVDEGDGDDGDGDDDTD